MGIEDLINEVVIHKVFGKGIIISSENGYIDCKFNNGKECKFQVPSCFDKFVKLADEEKQSKIEHAVDVWKEANGIYEKEQLHKKTLATQAGIKRREEEREIRRIKRAKEVAARNKMFVSM